MGVFDFFKRRKGGADKFNIDTCSLKDLVERGILFEDCRKFLKWGTPVKQFAKEIGAVERLFADRCVYLWGDRMVLNGLTLPLTTTFWYHKEESASRLFRSLCFTVTGNEEAEKYFGIISNHLEIQLGKPLKSELSETSKMLQWLIGDTRLHLYFFEQHVNKLNFEISRI